MLQQERAEYESGGSAVRHSTGDKFEGKTIKVVRGNTNRAERLEFFYGGATYADGPGHGHVICNDGVNIIYWRKPAHEGGRVVIDDLMSQERLSGHMF